MSEVSQHDDITVSGLYGIAGPTNQHGTPIHFKGGVCAHQAQVVNGAHQYIPGTGAGRVIANGPVRDDVRPDGLRAGGIARHPDLVMDGPGNRLDIDGPRTPGRIVNPQCGGGKQGPRRKNLTIGRNGNTMVATYARPIGALGSHLYGPGQHLGAGSVVISTYTPARAANPRYADRRADLVAPYTLAIRSHAGFKITALQRQDTVQQAGAHKSAQPFDAQGSVWRQGRHRAIGKTKRDKTVGCRRQYIALVKGGFSLRRLLVHERLPDNVRHDGLRFDLGNQCKRNPEFKADGQGIGVSYIVERL